MREEGEGAPQLAQPGACVSEGTGEEGWGLRSHGWQGGDETQCRCLCPLKP